MLSALTPTTSWNCRPITPTLRPVQTPGDIVKFWREKRGLSQAKLASEIGTTQQEIDKVEDNTRRMTWRWLERLAGGLDLKPWELLPGVDPKQVAEEQQILKIYRQLPADERQRLIRLAEALLPQGTPAQDDRYPTTPAAPTTLHEPD